MALAAVLCAYASILTWENEIQLAQADLDRRAQDVANHLKRELDSCMEAVNLTGSVFDSSGQLTREEFAAFTRGAMAGRSSLQALEYIPLVHDNDRAALEASARQEGFEDFSITERTPDGKLVPAPTRPLYYPVLYAEPLQDNRSVLGYDLGSNPVRLAAMVQARNTGEEVVSGKVQLVQGGSDENSILLFHPLFKKGAPAGSEKDRRGNLLGFSLGVLRMDKLLDFALADMPADDVSVWLLDKDAPAGDELLRSRIARPSGEKPSGWALAPLPQFKTSFFLGAARRHWELRFVSTPRFLASRLSWRPLFALANGLAILALLGLYLAMNLRLFALADARTAERARAELELREKIRRIEEAEKEARDKEEKLQIILKGIRAATLTIDGRTFAILDMNPTACALFGVTAKDWIGRPCHELLGRNLRPLDPKPDAVRTSDQGAHASAGGEFLLTRSDGKLVPVSRTVLSTSVLGATYIFEVLFDISEKKALERQLGLAQKLESIGQLASGIAHEINTPIQYVSGNLGFLKDAFQTLSTILARCDDLARCARTDTCGAALGELDQAKRQARFDALLAEIPGSISDSISGVERVATIVGAMKRFSHPDTAEKQIVDVNKAIESTLTITRNEWKYVAEARAELDPDLPLIWCSPGDFNQVLLNVVVNAAHAVSDKYKGTGRKGLITLRTFAQNGQVAIRIRDDGVGIPPENLDRIFDPFFTTKEVGRGTGQGLAIVHSIVDRHGGSIDLDSIPGRGTTFTIRFPEGREEDA